MNKRRWHQRSAADCSVEPYWNIYQVIAWVCTGYHGLLAQVADNAPKGSHLEDHTTLDGGTHMVKIKTDNRHLF